MNVLFILSGSVACYKACDAISQLVQRGHAVRTVATQAALKFVGVATLEGLTRAKVGVDLFESGAALDHIAWARWADVVVVCPATANTLNRMAAGLGDDLAAALWLAHDWSKPLLVVPAMNPAMWRHPATRASAKRLQEWGVRLVAPGEGRMACGEIGEGRLAEPAEIVAAIEAAMPKADAKRSAEKRVRVLVTSGGTSEPIDGVRVITNTSTGATGALIAERFATAGHDVVLLRARSAVGVQTRGCREATFGSFAELDEALRQELGAAEFDAIIHAAAVSDFAVDAVEVDGVSLRSRGAKLNSSGAAPVLRLRRNPKLLDSLRARSRNKEVCVVAFKLTDGASAAEARAAVTGVLAAGVADFVVHNDLTARAEGGAFPAEIWGGEGLVVESCAGRSELANALVRLVVRGVGRVAGVAPMHP